MVPWGEAVQGNFAIVTILKLIDELRILVFVVLISYIDLGKGQPTYSDEENEASEHGLAWVSPSMGTYELK